MNQYRRFAWLISAVSIVVLSVPALAVAGQWQPLFNGKDLTGWQPVGGAAGHWKAEDGVLYCQGGSGWLSTDKQYGDFELELEFRVPPGGNSGVFIRAPHEGNPAYQGMEIQVLDDYAPKYAKLRPVQYTGSIYDVVAASPRVTKKAGQWQKMVIRCEGPHVVVKVNGTKVVDANLNDYTDHLDKHPGLARKQGYIGLQNHGSRLDYRNIRIRTLP